MALFDEVQFPTDISEGAKQGPQFQTLVVATANASEQRVGQWASGRMRFDVSYGLKTGAQMAAVVAFFRARQGRLRGFRFKDWTDYQAAAEALVNPFPAATTQLQKTYSSGGVNSVRRVAKPVAGTVTVKKNGSPLTAGADYTLDTATGIVTFIGAEPTNGAAYTWDGQFDVPARFDTDQLSFTSESVDVKNWEAVPIIEVPL